MAEKEILNLDTLLSSEDSFQKQMIDTLLEFWIGQHETLRIAKQWDRYELQINQAYQTAIDAASRMPEDLPTLISSTRDLIEEIQGLSEDQVETAFHRAMDTIFENQRVTADKATNSAAERIRIRRNDLGLQPSQLVTLVGDFELFVSKVMGLWMQFDSSHIDSRKAEYSFHDLNRAGTIEELRQSMIHDFLDEHMRKSATDWFKLFCAVWETQGIYGANDNETIEIFQRRHVVVHHGGLASRQYLKNVKSKSPEINLGDHLHVSLEYVQNAADKLAAVAHSIVLTGLYFSAKSADSRREVEAKAGELTYILLTQHRDAVLNKYISTFEATRMSNEFAREQIRVNGWIAAKRIGKFSEIRDEIEHWDVSAKDSNFKLARLVLLDKIDESVDLIHRMIKANEFSMYALVTWPLFENIREELGEALIARFDD